MQQWEGLVIHFPYFPTAITGLDGSTARNSAGVNDVTFPRKFYQEAYSE